MAAAAATGFLSVPGAGASAMAGDQGQSGGSPGVLSGNSVEAPLSVPVNACGNSVDAVGALNPAMGDSCAEKNASAVASTDSGRGGGHGGGHGSGRPHAASGHDATAIGSSSARAPAPRAPRSASNSSGTTQSAGVLSGNSVQAPVSVDLNVCGNTVDVVGVGNPAFGNSCANGGEAAAVPTPSDGDERPPASHEEEGEGEGHPGAPPSSRAMSGSAHGSQARSALRQQDVRTGETVVDPQAPVARGRLAETGIDERVLGSAAAGAGLLLGGGILYRRSAAARR
ncbi:chaplin [Streptomyces kunmingensis]|uniref:chaplin n=1 Tax=Streptomyces kunmingensis TaxID=68225 RepID=UPI002D7A3D7B|nr:chaplin [Streptomyces kunmingensis]